MRINRTGKLEELDVERVQPIANSFGGSFLNLLHGQQLFNSYCSRMATEKAGKYVEYFKEELRASEYHLVLACYRAVRDELQKRQLWNKVV